MLEYWYSALASPCGIEITVSNVDLAKAKLYACRKEANDPDLARISVRVPPNKPQTLWLIHNASAQRETATPEAHP